MTEHLWYQPVIEAIFIKGLGAQLTPDIASALREEGINVDKLLPGYPVAQVVKACRRVTPLLWPQLSEADALAQLGALSTRGYNETLIGKAALALLKLLGIRRALEKLNGTLSAGNNYLKTSFAALSANSAKLTLSDASGIPDFYRGLFEEGARLLGAKNFVVRSGEAPAPAHEFICSWDA